MRVIHAKQLLVRYQLGRLLTRFVESKQLGTIYSNFDYLPPDLEFDPAWREKRREPDLIFIDQNRMSANIATGSRLRNNLINVVPDFVIETVSKIDLYFDVVGKISQYLSDGVTLVWVVNPWLKAVNAHIRGSDIIRKYNADQTLPGDPVLPGLEILVASLFE